VKQDLIDFDAEYKLGSLQHEPRCGLTMDTHPILTRNVDKPWSNKMQSNLISTIAQNMHVLPLIFCKQTSL